MSKQRDWLDLNRDTGSSRDALDDDSENSDVEVSRIRLMRPVLDPIVAQLRAERLRRRRLEPARSGRWTQKDIADRLGTHQSTVSEWESGMNLPPLPRLRAWSELFDLTLVLLNSAGELAA